MQWPQEASLKVKNGGLSVLRGRIASSGDFPWQIICRDERRHCDSVCEVHVQLTHRCIDMYIYMYANFVYCTCTGCSPNIFLSH